MNELTQIVELLLDDNISLSTTLRKISVFAFRIGNNNLYSWINNEINGYKNNKETPSYRKFISDIYYSYTELQGFGRYVRKTKKIEVEELDKSLIKTLRTSVLTQGIPELEDLNKQDGNVISSSHPSNFIKFEIDSSYVENTSIEARMSKSNINKVFNTVRDLCLKIILGLEKELGSEITLSYILSNKKESINNIIQNIMNQNNITSSGDGNLFNTGDNNQITQNIHIEKNNFEQLKKSLQNNNVEEADIIELENIIDTETPNIDTKIFGNKVNNWIKKMMGKALDGTWQVSIGAAGSILGEAIMKYYGM